MSKEPLHRYQQEWNVIKFRKLKRQELRYQVTEFTKSIEIGIKRVGDPTTDDGGLLAFKTGVNPITQKEWSKVSVGQKVISCAFAGKNWKVSLVEKGSDGNVKETNYVNDPIPEEEKTLTFNEIVGLMTNKIEAVLKDNKKDNKDVTTVSISLGFPQRNVKVNYGIDAVFKFKCQYVCLKTKNFVFQSIP